MNRNNGFRASDIAMFIAPAVICFGQLLPNQAPFSSFTVFGITLLYSAFLETCIHSIAQVAPEKRLRQWILLVAFMIPMVAVAWFITLFPAGMKPETSLGMATLAIAFHYSLHTWYRRGKPIEGEKGTF